MSAPPRHGGNIRELSEAAGLRPEEICDFSANINPLGPPAWLPEVLTASLRQIAHYPDPESRDLVRAIAGWYEVAQERIVPANGSAELIAWLPRILPVSAALIPVPTYGQYAVSCLAAGLHVRTCAIRISESADSDLDSVAAGLQGGEVVFLGRPNNPTGSFYQAAKVIELVSSFSSSWFVIDEAFLGFVAGLEEDPEAVLRAGLPNLVVLRSLTKLFAVPGLRVGFAVAPPEVVSKLRQVMAPWSVNVLAQIVGARAVTDQDYVKATQAFVVRQRERLAARLQGLGGITVFPSVTNFLLARLDIAEVDARWLGSRLLRRGIAIRVCDDFEGLDARYFRLAVRTQPENDRLVAELETVLAEAASGRSSADSA